jgi:hypothetical protein
MLDINDIERHGFPAKEKSEGFLVIRRQFSHAIHLIDDNRSGRYTLCGRNTERWGFDTMTPDARESARDFQLRASQKDAYARNICKRCCYSAITIQEA